jgi:hypothetical protein
VRVHPQGVLPVARCTATLAVDELVLTMADEAVHSRIPLDDTLDPAEVLTRISDGTMPVRLLWSHDDLDEALARDGWSRISPWRYGPTADVQRID